MRCFTKMELLRNPSLTNAIVIPTVALKQGKIKSDEDLQSLGRSEMELLNPFVVLGTMYGLPGVDNREATIAKFSMFICKRKRASS